MKFFIVALLFGASLVSTVAAQSTKPLPMEQLAAYNKPDREKMLIRRRQSEGKITWYTSLAGNSYKELAAAFEGKYPGVRVESYRATRQEMSARIMAESQAQRYIADTIETTIPLLKLLKDNRCWSPYYFPTQAKFPDHVKEKASQRSRLTGPSTANRTSVLPTIKTLVPANLAPKNYQGLLRPELEGQNRVCRQRHRRHRHRRDAQVQGEEYVKKLKSSESRDSQCLGARAARHGHLRRSRRLADNLSQPRRSIAESRRAHRMDPDGRRAVQFRLYRDFGQSAASACGVACSPISSSVKAAKRFLKSTSTAIRRKIMASSVGIPSKG